MYTTTLQWGVSTFKSKLSYQGYEWISYTWYQALSIHFYLTMVLCKNDTHQFDCFLVMHIGLWHSSLKIRGEVHYRMVVKLCTKFSSFWITNDICQVACHQNIFRFLLKPNLANYVMLHYLKVSSILKV